MYMYVLSLVCCCLTVTSPLINSALTFPDDKVNPPTALGQLLWEWTGQYLCLGCVCTVRVSVRVGETSTSRLWVTWALAAQATLSPHSCTLPPPPALYPLLILLLLGYFLVLVWVVFVLALFVFAFPCCAASLSYVGMSSHILATVAACVAVTCMTFFDHWQWSVF